MKLLSITLLLLSTVSNLSAQNLLEIINTEANEYGIAFISEDLVCFTRSEGEKKLMLTEKINGSWSEPLVAPFSKDWDDEYPTFDRTISRLYFSSTRPKPGESSVQARNDIWYVTYQDGVWSTPTHLGGVFSEKGIDSGAFGKGNQVFFHSDRSGAGMNSVDIYVASTEAETPEKLSINTETVDGEVHLFNNGNSMLFMSAGHNAVGRSDIFLSHYTSGEWSLPVPIDTTGSINTEAWEYSPSLSLDGQTLYFTRITNGNADILSYPVEKLSYSLFSD